MRKLLVGAAAVALLLSSVAGSSPGQASADVVGPVTGTITYGGDGIPPHQAGWPPGEPCRETTFDLSLQSVIAVQYGNLSYKGPVTITGTGRSGYDDNWRVCEAVWKWTGSHGIHFLSVIGTDATGVTLRCEQLAGTWLRYLTEWLSVTKGDCTIGGSTVPIWEVYVAAEWVPTPAGAGVVTDVTGATLAGALSM